MRSTDHLDSNYNFDIQIEKLANGFTKASAAGLVVNDRSQEHAVNQLEQKLREAVLQGELYPGK
jgi:hypothetical protein